MAVEHEGPREPLEGQAADPSAELLAALRVRDPAVLPRLLETHGRELGAVASLILRDRAEAEDVVVEALLGVLERGAGLLDGVALRTRLLRIATDRAVARRRRRPRVVPLEVVDTGDGGLGDPRHLATRATALNAVNRLPPRRRAALVLRSYAGCSVGDVAAILGLGRDDAAAELRTALTHLRAEIGPGGPLPTAPMVGPDRVAVDPLEELLERVLRQAALPVEVPPERLVAALAERRRRAARRRSLVLLAAAAVLLGGLGAFLGTRGRDAVPTPGPSEVPTSVASAAPASPGPFSARPASAVPTIAAVPSLAAVPAGRVDIDHAEAGSPTGSVARRWIGDVGPRRPPGFRPRSFGRRPAGDRDPPGAGLRVDRRAWRPVTRDQRRRRPRGAEHRRHLRSSTPSAAFASAAARSSRSARTRPERGPRSHRPVRDSSSPSRPSPPLPHLVVGRLGGGARP
ncbi:MAG: hypothetical protein KatS3mg065_0216 [Chloroflexota bacterium]|nr:MAG: hypothetical protein KatS3mg065_0216 [Chloroflexota bacterium]